MLDLTKGKESKVILSFTLPILLGNLFQQLYNVVDSIVVGNYLGKESLAAVGFSYQFNLILVILSMGITMGTSILISKCFGAGEMSRVKKIMDTGIIFSFVLSVCITILGVIFCRKLLLFFRMPRDTVDMADNYLRIIFLGVIPSFAYNTLTNILRGMGDSKTSTNILVLAMLLNIMLDINFVAGLKIGITGAALATVISQTFSCVACFFYINRCYPKFRITIHKLQFDQRELKNSLKLGIPTMLQQLFISIGFLSIQYMINGFGTDCIAAYTAASKIDAFAELPVLNLGKAMTNFTAQNLGAKQPERVKRGCRDAFKLSVFISIFLSVVILLSSRFLIRMFVKDPAVVAIGTGYLKIIACFYAVFGVMHLLNGIILGYSKTFIPMISSIASLCCLQVPAGILLSQTKLAYTGIWIAAPIGWAGGVLIRFFYYQKVICTSKMTKE